MKLTNLHFSIIRPTFVKVALFAWKNGVVGKG
jgi:hypothetical protein